MNKRVVILGDVMLDVVVQPLSLVAPTSDTPANIRVTRGGAGANVAIALSASGLDVVYVGAGGNDAARQVFIEALRRRDVEAQLQSVEGPTGTVVVIVANDGQRAMLSDRGANAHLSWSFVAEQLREPFDHLHVSGYLLLDPATRGVGVNALALASARGLSTSVDVCSVAPLRRVTPSVFLDAAKNSSMFFANNEEALAISATQNVEDAANALGALFDEVIITKGEHGALVARGDERISVAAHVVEVLDTTGAGDAATGAYLGARLQGEDPLVALERAMASSASVLGGLGALG